MRFRSRQRNPSPAIYLPCFRLFACRTTAMASSPRPRTIARHELVGMGCTSSQLAMRDWKALESPRRPKLLSGVEPPARSPRPKYVGLPSSCQHPLQLVV